MRLNRPIQTRFRYGCAPMALNLAAYDNSPVHYPRGTQSAVRRSGIGLLQLVSRWFQVLLTPLAGVLFTVQSPYWSTIGRAGVLSLAGWAPHLQSEFHGIRPTRPPSLACRLQDCHLLWSPVPERSAGLTTAYGSRPWAVPRSLATTCGVSVDFLSSRY